MNNYKIPGPETLDSGFWTRKNSKIGSLEAGRSVFFVREYVSALNFISHRSWSRKISTNVILHSRIDADGSSRSIVVDYLQEHFKSENVAVVFVYFDYKAQQSQTAIDVRTNLLKQLLSHFEDIPAQLEAIYEGSARGNSRPDQLIVTQLLRSCSRRYTSVFAVFDALDECNESHQTEILKLFADLQGFGYRLCISFRPHSKRLLNTPYDSKTIEISADQSDLTNYVLTRLKQKKNQSGELKDRCLQLVKGVDGMYVTLYFVC